jgi:hypothetical protein
MSMTPSLSKTALDRYLVVKYIIYARAALRVEPLVRQRELFEMELASRLRFIAEEGEVRSQPSLCHPFECASFMKDGLLSRLRYLYNNGLIRSPTIHLMAGCSSTCGVVSNQDHINYLPLRYD